MFVLYVYFLQFYVFLCLFVYFCKMKPSSGPEAKEHLDLLIECVQELHDVRKQMLEDLETSNLTSETMRSSIPNLRRKHELDHVS